MKNIAVLIAIVAIGFVLFAGFGIFKDSKETVTNYGEAQVAAKRSAESGRVQGDLRALRTNIQAFLAEKGRYPDSLDELVSSGVMRHLPEDPTGQGYDYDSSTGKVTSRFNPEW